MTDLPLQRRAVIFDLDGTLVNSLEDLADSVNAVLGRFGFAPHELQAYRYFVGDGVEALVRRAFPEPQPGGPTLDDWVAAVRKEYGGRYALKTRPYPEVPELLGALESRGVKIAVLSNKPHEATLRVVSELLGTWRFDAVLGVRPSRPKKPDPSGALEIAQSLGVPPSSCLYLGDTDVDMRTATGAGMLAVGALWGFRTEAELRDAGAQALVASPLEVLDLLDGPA